MREIIVHRKEWKPNDRRHQAPILDGLNEPVTLIDGDSGEKLAVQYLLGDRFMDERRRLARQLRLGTEWNDKKQLKPSNGSSRLNGMRYENRTFGTVAPAPLRQRYGCSHAAFNFEYPDAYKTLGIMTEVAWEILEAEMPNHAANHRLLVEEAINTDWWINDVPWTSGIINNTAALPYHRDRANIKGTLSSMLCLRSKVGGGHLDLPEYGVTLGIPDGSLTMFDGQDVWHGVTPLINEWVDAYRYTIVLYAKSGCKACGCAENEALRAARRATDLSDIK